MALLNNFFSEQEIQFLDKINNSYRKHYFPNDLFPNWSNCSCALRWNDFKEYKTTSVESIETAFKEFNRFVDIGLGYWNERKKEWMYWIDLTDYEQFKELYETAKTRFFCSPDFL